MPTFQNHQLGILKQIHGGGWERLSNLSRVELTRVELWVCFHEVIIYFAATGSQVSETPPNPL
jgi:hypothetical protein